MILVRDLLRSTVSLTVLLSAVRLTAPRLGGAEAGTPRAASVVASSVNAIAAGAPEWADLVKRYAAKPDGIAEFEERRHFPFRKEPVVLKGEVRVSARHGLSLHYTAPDERTIILDEKGMLVRDPAGTKAPPPDPRGNAANEAMRHILRLDFAALEKSFALTGVRGDDEWTLTLVPRDASVRRAIGDIHVAGDAVSVRRIELRKSAKQHIDIAMTPAREVGAFAADEVKRFFR